MNYLKHDRIFRGILSNIGLYLSPLSGIINFNIDIKYKEVYVYY